MSPRISFLIITLCGRLVVICMCGVRRACRSARCSPRTARLPRKPLQKQQRGSPKKKSEESSSPEEKLNCVKETIRTSIGLMVKGDKERRLRLAVVKKAAYGSK
jgi:hypothetical protein